MALISPGHQFRILGVVIHILLSSLVASHKLESQLNLMNINKIKPERNATIALFPISNICCCSRESLSCNKYLLNNFTLAPEVCLSGLSPQNDFRLLEMPKCVDRGRETTAVLITYSDENCTGPVMVQPSPLLGPPYGHIGFPFPPPPGPGRRWSLIFHCHSEPFDEVSDPLKREYTTGEKLQEPLKHHGPLALCERRLPRLTDGLIQLVYEGCSGSQMDAWKIYELPIETCQSTGRGNGLKIIKPGMCTDGSRARMARYWDDECKELYALTEIKDDDFVLDTCQLLNVTTLQVGSMAFYCDGPDDLGDARDALVDSTEGKEITLPEPMLKLESTTLPPKPWVPFWKGLILIDMVINSPQDRYINPKFEILGTDSCHTELSSPLKIFQVPRCFNGTRANVAFFTWSSCKGSPVFYDGTDKEIFDKMFCMSTSNGYNSLAFWCEGTGLWQYVPPRRQVQSSQP